MRKGPSLAAVVVVSLWVLLGVRAGGAAQPEPRTSPSPAVSASPLQITLEEALTRSVDTSPTLRVYLSQIAQARYEVSQAYVDLNPTLSLSTTYTRTLVPTSSTTTNPFITFIDRVFHANINATSSSNPDNYNVTAVLQQTIFTFGRVRWNVLAAKLYVKQVQQQLRTQIETLLQTVEQNYIACQYDAAIEAIYQSQVAYYTGYVTLSQALFRGGEVPEFDVIQYQSQVSLAQQELELAANELQTDEASLLSAMGLPPHTPVEVVAFADMPPPPGSLDEGLARALERRPEITALEWALASAEAEVKAVALMNAPSVAVQSQYSGANNSSNTYSNTWVSGVVMSVPILDGGEARLAKKVQEEVVKQTRGYLEEARRSVTLSVTQAWQDLVSQWRQMAQAQVAVDQANEAVGIAAIRYREGVSSSVELLSAQEQAVSTQLTLAGTKASYLTSYANWRRAISEEPRVALPEALRKEWAVDAPEVKR